MRNPIIKSALAILLSIASAAVLAMSVEGFGSILHPLPEGFSGEADEVASHVSSYPAFSLAGWATS